MNQRQSWARRRDCATQTLDLRGLGYDSSLHRQYGGALRGSDLDWCMEIHDTPAHPMRRNVYLLAEVKCDRPHSTMPDGSGQKQALERICDDLYRPGKTLAYAAEVIHKTYDTAEDIDAASCVVSRYYDPHRGAWRDVTSGRTLAEWQDAVIEYYRRQ